MTRPQRKPNRLADFDYSTPGAYFITICTQEKKCILSHIVGGGAFDAPSPCLTKVGLIAEKYILSGNRIPGITVDKYVIMPNHIHMILLIDENSFSTSLKTLSPANAAIPHFVSTFKRFCHRDIGSAIFQRSYHDHVIRNEEDYRQLWNYIDGNPSKWQEDRFCPE